MKAFRAPALAALALAASGYAAAATFTDDVLFSTAVAGMTIGLETFATLPVGTIVHSGERINDITYDFVLRDGGTKGEIVDCFSGHCLSKLNASAFFVGDHLQFSFATPVNAFGVFNFPLGSDGTGTTFYLISNGASPEAASTFGRFAGIVSPTAFTSVVFYDVRDPNNFGTFIYPWIIPGIVYATAVPEPQPYLLLAAGLLVLALPARRRA